MSVSGLVLNVGSYHDRDINAARNIEAVGLTVVEACGEAIRPGAVKAKNGQASAKQERPTRECWNPLPQRHGEYESNREEKWNGGNKPIFSTPLYI